MATHLTAPGAVLLGLSLVFVGAAAGPGDTQPAEALALSGHILAGQFAAAASDETVAANDYLAALRVDPGDAELQRAALYAGILSERPDTVDLARQQPLDPAAILVLADADVRRGDWHAAQARFAALPNRGRLQALRTMLIAWAQAGSGATDQALGTLQPGIDGGRYQGILALHAALVLDQAGRLAEAGRFYRIAAADYGSLNLRLGLLLASWQARDGQGAEARATMHALVRANPDLAIAEPALQQSAGLPQMRSAADGVAEAYLALAADQQQGNDGLPLGILLRLALDMRPDFASARLLLAEREAGSGQPAAAAATLAKIPTSDPLSSLAALRQAQYLDRAGDAAAARAMLRSMAASRPDRPEPLAVLAQIQRRSGHFGEAAATYGEAIARVPQPGPADWPLFYEQGVSYDRAHDWARAEADFLQALKLAPDEPFVLNYLGYGWAEQGHHLSQARQMIERAVQQMPSDGSVVDSLGWVLLRQGHTADAVRFLERAAELQPEDATINGHLGDAYMADGRAREAQTQWRRALVLKPDAEEQAALAAKLATAQHPDPVAGPPASRAAE